MELPEIVEFARNYSVMVRINGPDPKGLKMRNHAFHQYHSGKTTLSASGFLLPANLYYVYDLLDSNRVPGSAVIVTVASIVLPFLSQNSKEANVQARPELIAGTQIDVLLEGKLGAQDKLDGSDKGASQWFDAQVLKVVNISVYSSAIQSLIGASSESLEHGWEVGWSLASHNHQKFNDAVLKQENNVIPPSCEVRSHLTEGKLSDGNQMGKSTTGIAFLQVNCLLNKDLPEIKISPVSKRGDALLAMGSPFGILSPVHFFNSISVGFVSNCYAPTSQDASLLMADIRCLPGMEGGPVLGEHAHLVGLLTRPLRQSTGAEVQMVISWQAIEAACSNSCQLIPEDQNTGRGFHYIEPSFRNEKTMALNSIDPSFSKKHAMSGTATPSRVEQAMTSICLISLDDGIWASGVLLNHQGLVLTNAHLLEPWRFGGTPMQGDRDGKRPESFLPQYPTSSLDVLDEGHGSYRAHKYHRNVRVRLDHVDPWIWCPAKVVYVSKGPLDISLLQLESVPCRLCPIDVDLACPAPGSKVFVVGHGLSGPRCDLFPSVYFGVISKVVKMERDAGGRQPAMLETTASVHPGGSGGAIVNSAGHMIGLVTSNAKHGRGTVIPHMNFSIPSAALEPVFKYSKDMRNLSLLQELDRPNKELSAKWAMMPPLSPDPAPWLPGIDELPIKDDAKQGKGSRFAKFMAERQELIKKSRESRDTIPSKL